MIPPHFLIQLSQQKSYTLHTLPQPYSYHHYLFIYFIYLSIYLFIYLFIYLLIYLFIYL